MSSTDLLEASQLRFGLTGGPFVLGFVALLCLLLVVIGAREHREIARPARRALLNGLRVASALALLLFVLRPEWIGQRVEHVQGRIAVLLDVSRSMLVREDGSSRRERALESVRAMLAHTQKQPELFVFGAELSPITRAALERADEPRSAGGALNPLGPRDDTRIGRALGELVQARPNELGAVVLVSDGADRSSQFDPRALSALGVRVHTVAIGGESALRDTAIQSVQVDPIAFLRQPAEAVVTIQSSHLRSVPVVVSLRRGSELVRETTAQLDEHGQASVTLTWTPTRLGRGVYTVSIPTDQDDAVPENNERGFLLRVTRERLRALLVCGHPSWDARFLRTFLKSNPAIDLITFFILRTPNDSNATSSDELSLIPFPTEELFEQHLASFDLVIFQDFDFGPYQMARYLPRIRDYVLTGGSFAMLGGDRSFSAGGYADTAIAEILPVKLARHGRHVDHAEFAPVVVGEATHHPVVELAPRPMDNLNAWKSLAPLLGTDLVAGLRDGAHALLVHPSLSSEDGTPMPVLSVSSPGRGRALALTTDSAYRWGMPTAGRTGDASVYERFWDRALRWLARDPLLDPAQITTDRESYGPGARVRAGVWLRDELYRPLGPGLFRVALLNDRGASQRELPLEVDGEGRGNVDMIGPERAGAYALSVKKEGTAEVLAEQGFVVETGGDELADPRARPDWMREIARATSGTYHASGTSPPALDRLTSTRTRVLGSDVHSPFASGWYFALLIGLLALEWTLRRRFGLR